MSLILKRLSAWTGLVLALAMGFALAYYWGFVLVTGHPHPQSHQHLGAWETLLGLLLIACNVQVWHMWRK